MRFRVIVRLIALAAVALLVALVAVVKSIDVHAYRDMLGQAAKVATGRDLTVGGRLSLKVSLSPALVAEDVSLSNVAWGGRPAMIHVKRLEAEIGFLPLLGRQVRIQRLVLIEPDILLERNGAGQDNWSFGGIDPGQVPGEQVSDKATVAAGVPTVFDIAELRIVKGKVTFNDARSGRHETVDMDRLTADAPGYGANIGLLAVGAWNGRHYDISGRLGPTPLLMAALASAQGKPYPLELKAVMPGLVATLAGSVTSGKAGPLLDLKVSAEAADLADTGHILGVDLPSLGTARATMTVGGALDSPSISDIDAALGRKDAVAFTAKGGVKHPLDGRGLDLLVSAESDNLVGLDKALDLALPLVGPVKASARLTDLTGGGWRLSDIRGMLGHSDLTGEASLKPEADSRFLVQARLNSQAVHLDEVLGGHNESQSKPVARAPDARVFSDAPLPLAALRGNDLDLQWKIDRVMDEPLLAQQVDVSVRLDNGRLVVVPAIGSVAGGKLNARLTVDASGKVAVASLSLDAEKLGLGELLRGLKLNRSLKGARSDVKLNISGTGNSLRAIMSRLNGDTALVSDQGRIEGANADALAVDVLRQLAPWSDDKDTEMRCLMSRFVISDGLAKSDIFLFDTSHMTVGGKGSVNLANESIDLTLAPRPKEPSLLSLAVPIDVGGTLAEPSVAPNKGAIVKGVASAMGGLALGPIGLLMPLVSAGSMDANPCVAALAQVKKASQGPSGKKGRKGKGAKTPAPPPPGSAAELLQSLFGH